MAASEYALMESAVRYPLRLVSIRRFLISGLNATEWMRMSMPPNSRPTVSMHPRIE